MLYALAPIAMMFMVIPMFFSFMAMVEWASKDDLGDRSLPMALFFVAILSVSTVIFLYLLNIAVQPHYTVTVTY
jgi:Na+/H+ antiporter NhaC